MASHKYISKFFKNGRWQYNYGQKGPYGGSTPASSNRSPSGGPTSSGFKTTKNLKVSNTLDSIKYKLNNTQKKIKRKAWQLKNRYNMQKDQLKRAVKGSAAYKKAKATMKSIKKKYVDLKNKYNRTKSVSKIAKKASKKLNNYNSGSTYNSGPGPYMGSKCFPFLQFDGGIKYAKS